MNKADDPLGIRTLAVHAGEEPDPATGASAPNIVMSTTFIAQPDASFSVEGLNEETPYIYTRWGNPTVDQLERKLAALEGAESCIAFASGMAAVSALLLHTLGSGDHVVVSDVTYAATAELTDDLLPRMGIAVSKVNLSDLRCSRSSDRAPGLSTSACRGSSPLPLQPQGGAGELSLARVCRCNGPHRKMPHMLSAVCPATWFPPW